MSRAGSVEEAKRKAGIDGYYTVVLGIGGAIFITDRVEYQEAILDGLKL